MIAAALSSRLKSTDRLEEHVGGWQPNNTVDVVRDMSSLRSWSPEEGEDSYEGGGAYPLVSFLSRFDASFGRQCSKCYLSWF